MECIFCQIIQGKAPARIVYQDDLATAFEDIHPIAPVHVLVVPNQHVASVNDVEAADEAVLGHLFSAAKKVAEIKGLTQRGYRLIVNNGPEAGQAVFHLHIHVLGGKRMRFSTD